MNYFNKYYHRVPKEIVKFWAFEGYYNPHIQENSQWIVANHDKFVNPNYIARLGYYYDDHVVYFLYGTSYEKEYSEEEMLRLIKLKAFL